MCTRKSERVGNAEEGGISECGALFLAGLRDVQQAGEHQVGNLFDDRDGIGDATGVEVQPEGVDFIAVGGGEGHVG
jgi:hypothetical protein